MRTHLAGFCLAALFGPPLAFGALLQKDISYGEAGGETLRLDACTPEGAGPFPVVILVHGGGWSSGDKAGAEKPNSGADITPWFEPLTEAGFVWFSINYRLAPAHRWPACLEDTRTAVAWVRAHAPEFGGDPARIALLGHSAGGHLALMAALPVEPGAPAPVQAVVGCAPVSDFVADMERRGGLSRSMQDLFNLPQESTPAAVEILRANSPLTHLTAACPPVLILHGEADKTVPLAQSRAFLERAHALGVECELHVLPAAGHRLTEWTAHDPAWPRVLTGWLRGRLGPAPGGTSGRVNNATPASLTPAAP